jgi:prepilin-type N-terminal cleavage/methylation domain-containing protein
MSRRAFTLIETLVVMTVGSVVLAIAIGMLHLLLRAENTGRDRVSHATVSARLAEQFRNDAAEALRTIPTPDHAASQCQFALPDGREVAYRVLPNEVQRDERAAGKTVRQESYMLPEDRVAVFGMESSAKPVRASLVITGDGTRLPAGRELRIVAVVGKDHRFTKSDGGSK